MAFAGIAAPQADPVHFWIVALMSNELVPCCWATTSTSFVVRLGTEIPLALVTFGFWLNSKSKNVVPVFEARSTPTNVQRWLFGPGGSGWS